MIHNFLIPCTPPKTNIAHLSSKEIISLLKNDDVQGFESVFIHYHPKLKLFISGFLKDNEIALDLAQDVFVKLWQNRHKLDNVQDFNAYLFRCAKNEMLNYIKRLDLSIQHIENELNNNKNSIDPETEYIAAETTSLVKALVESMPPQRKLIFEMSRYQGFSNQEIAEKLNLNKRTVENHLTLALKSIRQSLLTIAVSILTSTLH